MYFWYCCILPTERAAIDALSINFVTALGQPMPRVIWDVIWATATWGGAERTAAALASWSLEYTEIVIPDEPPVPAVGYTDYAAWAALAAYVVAPGPKCTDGCTQPSWP